MQILQSTNPRKDNWIKIASIEDFEPCEPRTDPMSVGQSGIWDMISYNESLYAFIGTGHDSNSTKMGIQYLKEPISQKILGLTVKVGFGK